MMPQNRWLTHFLLIMVSAVIFCVAIPTAHAGTVTAVSDSASATPMTPSDAPQVRVMTIGASVAHGWNDPEHNGYLHRTFTALTKQYGVTYAVYDKTIVGANAVQLQETLYKGDYEKWLVWIHPNIVVISWGLLNDCLPKTPMAQFDKDVGAEIREALRAHAAVFVVTPPVTKASYTQYETQEQAYVNEEIAIVKRFANPNVHLFDVYDQMKQFIADNQLTYVPFSADGWHPNSAGHQLAAHFLISDINSAYPLEAPAAPNPSPPAWSTHW